jgi:hypothetical protein
MRLVTIWIAVNETVQKSVDIAFPLTVQMVVLDICGDLRRHNVADVLIVPDHVPDLP